MKATFLWRGELHGIWRATGRSMALGLLLLCSAAAQAAITCNVTARNVGELYDAAAASTGVQGDLRINCTRMAGDPAIVYYSMDANFGLNTTGGVTRKLKNPTDNSTLIYSLRNSVGALGCGLNSNWGVGTLLPRLLQGSLSFTGASLVATQQLNSAYCLRVPGIGGGNPVAPTAGTFVDTITITPDMSTTSVGGPYNVTAPATQFTFTMGVNPICVVRKQGDDLFFNYTALSSPLLTDESNFQVICSNSLPYKVTVSPATGTIAGINYTVVRAGAKDRTGNGNQQAAKVKVNIAGGQAGTCATAVCSGVNTHTLTIEY